MSRTIPTLTTPRLELRPWSLEDAEALHLILQEEGILRYFPKQDPPPIEKVLRYIAHHLQHWEGRGYGHWAVTERKNGAVIGWTGLEFLPETSETEVAYLLSRSFWGKGLATEAAKSAVAYGLEAVGLESIIGLSHPENKASRRVLEKCGLTFVDRRVYFGMELCRYRIERRDSE